jgi:predicted Zn-ribbon and HTH transcriptional regulator
MSDQPLTDEQIMRTATAVRKTLKLTDAQTAEMIATMKRTRAIPMAKKTTDSGSATDKRFLTRKSGTKNQVGKVFPVVSGDKDPNPINKLLGIKEGSSVDSVEDTTSQPKVCSQCGHEFDPNDIHDPMYVGGKCRWCANQAIGAKPNNWEPKKPNCSHCQEPIGGSGYQRDDGKVFCKACRDGLKSGELEASV